MAPAAGDGATICRYGAGTQCGAVTSSHTIVVRAQVLFILYIVEDTRFETLWSQILENLTLFRFRLNTLLLLLPFKNIHTIPS